MSDVVRVGFWPDDPEPRYRLGPATVTATRTVHYREQSLAEWEAEYLASLSTLDEMEAELLAEVAELEGTREGRYVHPGRT